MILPIEHLGTIRALEGCLARVLPDVINCNLRHRKRERESSIVEGALHSVFLCLKSLLIRILISLSPRTTFQRMV